MNLGKSVRQKEPLSAFWTPYRNWENSAPSQLRGASLECDGPAPLWPVLASDLSNKNTQPSQPFHP
jgi:hypothetical protein